MPFCDAVSKHTSDNVLISFLWFQVNKANGCYVGVVIQRAISKGKRPLRYLTDKVIDGCIRDLFSLIYFLKMLFTLVSGLPSICTVGCHAAPIQLIHLATGTIIW